jgi:hypothetical protein
MSQQTVGLIVERLLTDELLRMQLACYPLETIVDLQVEGLELTPGEIDILLQTDAQTWCWLDYDVEGRGRGRTSMNGGDVFTSIC